ncbi:radical SAM protein [Eubacterium oxidoreducens]|uniref:Radical SAM superfamily enzyme, MoaA/NifB/PqqE/SkfB family n=1 Tax=Eubacterium oxidoreducens TaxID=1732 RepID=A0A1G6AUM6_EUBOX|nr:radical SAM protein [Eubacterium oxidoreducens]SDB12071.1 Radical SAM superfamily enzyme, MoaA/NifB/PqqE/SkfB family [Eubacterium oxidoreducens]
MANITHTMQRKAFSAAIDVALKRLNKDREKGLLQIIELAKKFMGDNFTDEAFEGAKKLATDKNHKWNKFVNKMLDELDPNVAKMTALNLGFEAAFHGTKTIRHMREVHNCNIPWLILMDPTSACNLRCTGCWAAEYGYKLNLTFEEMDSIVTQGKELGVYLYMFTGGEPLVRKDDILKLCKKHRDVAFHSYTNGTLIDEEFCKEVQKVGNLSFSLSLEGFEEANDGRRGDGIFKKVLNAMDLMREYGLFYGCSVCYTRKNLDAVTSDEFIDLMIDHGCRYAWYFHYMPVGNEADTELLLTPEQRVYIYNRLREIRAFEGGKPIMLMDFQNDGEFVGGCIAGGRNYFHINANGDAEPCVFIHYSGANIRKNTLLECLKQPLFMAYRDGQPFNDNMLKPCPMLENPEKLREMVHKSGAVSTDLQSPESVEHLTEKCQPYADSWNEEADRLWAENPHVKRGYINYKKENLDGFLERNKEVIESENETIDNKEKVASNR